MSRVVGELVAAAVPQHVGVDLQLETGFGADPLEQLEIITRRRGGSKKTRLTTEKIADHYYYDLCTLPV